MTRIVLGASHAFATGKREPTVAVSKPIWCDCQFSNNTVKQARLVTEYEMIAYMLYATAEHHGIVQLPSTVSMEDA